MVRHHRRTPGMQDQRQTGSGAQMSRISCDGLHRLGGRLEQHGVDDRLVVVGETADRRRQCEHQVVVLHRQQIGLARVEPTPGGAALAGGTVAIAAGVVGDLAVIAGGTTQYMAAERRGAAGLDGRHHLELAEADMPPVRLTPRLAPGPEDVSHLQA